MRAEYFRRKCSARLRTIARERSGLSAQRAQRRTRVSMMQGKRDQMLCAVFQLPRQRPVIRWSLFDHHVFAQS